MNTRLPHFASWSIDYVYPSQHGSTPQRPAGDPQPVRTVFTRTGNVFHEQRTFAEGADGELWSDGKVTVERKPGQTELSAVLSLQTPGDDFPDFDWVAKGNYLGFAVQDGEKCLVFGENKFSAEGDFLGPAYAYVDYTTRLPVIFETPSLSQKYTILSPPATAIAMPEAAVAAAKAMQDQIRKATPHLGAP